MSDWADERIQLAPDAREALWPLRSSHAAGTANDVGAGSSRPVGLLGMSG